MCRMIAFAGGKSANLEPLHQAFRTGSRCDPYVKKAFGDEFTCHPHGWGMAFYDGRNLHHFRTSLPAWEQAVPLPPAAGETVYLILHSRLASNPALAGPICSHPFAAGSDTEWLLLAHNGSVEVDAAAPVGMVDSEWALGEIVRAGGIEAALPGLQARTRPYSALNLLVLAVARDGRVPPMIHCLNY